MRTFVLSKYQAEVEEQEVPEPTIGEHDVLIAIEAAGLNHLDERIRTGEFKAILPYKMPLILGHDLAGTVLSVGSKVQNFQVGDKVYGRPRDFHIGTFAERIAVNENDIALAPTSITTIEAASLPLVALTAWQALIEIADVQPGHKVLIHAGAGGVGNIAIQLAKYLGAHVTTTASAKNKEFLLELGADEVIDYRSQDFSTILSDFDVVLDSLGGENLLKSLHILRKGGIAVGISGPPTPEFAAAAGLNPIVRLATAALSFKTRRRAKQLDVSYQFLFMHASGAQLKKITTLIDENLIRPVVGETLPFAQVPTALKAVDHSTVRGKTVFSSNL